MWATLFLIIFSRVSMSGTLIITSGIWFNSFNAASGELLAKSAYPMAGWGISPSPAIRCINHDYSLKGFIRNTLAVSEASRFPTPGGFARIFLNSSSNSQVKPMGRNFAVFVQDRLDIRLNALATTSLNRPQTPP